MPSRGRIITLGQGARDFHDFVGVLRHRTVEFVIDVRSRPRSGFRPEFSRDPLDAALRSHGIRYVFMGDLLGGTPDDPSCYVNGKVDYTACREKDFFQLGLKRLRSAIEQGHTVCLMCSEGDPGRCHRSKLIGAALSDAGVDVDHILPDGSMITQNAVIEELTGGQTSLFGTAFTSRRAYG